MLHIDHVIYGTGDVEAAAGRLWEEHGFAWLELAGDKRRVEDSVGGATELPLRIVDDQPRGLRAAAIALDDGAEIVIR